MPSIVHVALTYASSGLAVLDTRAYIMYVE